MQTRMTLFPNVCPLNLFCLDLNPLLCQRLSYTWRSVSRLVACALLLSGGGLRCALAADGWAQKTGDDKVRQVTIRNLLITEVEGSTSWNRLQWW